MKFQVAQMQYETVYGFNITTDAYLVPRGLVHPSFEDALAHLLVLRRQCEVVCSSPIGEALTGEEEGGIEACRGDRDMSYGDLVITVIDDDEKKRWFKRAE